ncbi:MAG: pseudouridine synthase [Patescibacteria group bacterium]
MNHSKKKPLHKKRPNAKNAVVYEDPTFPMRINKYLAWKKHSTRRGADEMIEKGQVLLNGKRAALGDKVTETDVIEVRFRVKPKPYVYFAYHKPRGIVTHSPVRGERDIKSQVKMSDVFPVGRLDKDSSGLVILTNDGRITDRLLSPRYDHEKEYLVTTKNPLRSSFQAKMEAGVQIEDEMTAPCRVKILDDRTFQVILTEGKKHQIRRMCVALFQEVDTLERLRVMNIELGALAPNSHRKITGDELKKFLELLDLA